MSYSLTFSKTIIMVMFIADKVRQKHYDFVPTKVLSEVLNIPVPTAVKIIQGLNRSGIIETREGVKGGVRLAKQFEEITILDIFNAIELNRPLFRNDFNLNVTGIKPSLSQDVVTNVLNNAENEMKKQLEIVTIADLLEKTNS